MNADFQIQGKETTTTGTCYVPEDMRNETARNTTIVSAVETARHYGIVDDVILVDIVTRFDLKENDSDFRLEQASFVRLPKGLPISFREAFSWSNEIPYHMNFLG